MKENKFNIECECGCAILSFADFTDEPNEKYIIMSHYGSTFAEKQMGVFETIKRRVALAWHMLTGKEYRLYDIVIEKEKFKEFKKFINKIGAEE
jgi:hypothetical protein